MRFRMNYHIRRFTFLLGLVCGFIAAYPKIAVCQDEKVERKMEKIDRLKQREGVSHELGYASPADETPSNQIRIGELDVARWLPDSATALPLVIFSHGFHSCNTQSSTLMQAISAAGYIVFAPNHRDARCEHGGIGLEKPQEKFRDAGSWNDHTYQDRSSDLLKLITALKESDSWSAKIDFTKVALVGHSLGGYTVLGVAGGWPAWKIPGITAVLALSPYCQPFVLAHGLTSLNIPIMYQGGTQDIGITPSIKKAGGAYDATAKPAYFVEFAKAGHLAWTDLKQEHQKEIAYYSIAFLDRYLKQLDNDDLTKRLPGVSVLKSK